MARRFPVFGQGVAGPVRERIIKTVFRILPGFLRLGKGKPAIGPAGKGQKIGRVLRPAVLPVPHHPDPVPGVFELAHRQQGSPFFDEGCHPLNGPEIGTAGWTALLFFPASFQDRRHGKGSQPKQGHEVRGPAQQQGHRLVRSVQDPMADPQGLAAAPDVQKNHVGGLQAFGHGAGRHRLLLDVVGGEHPHVEDMAVAIPEQGRSRRQRFGEGRVDDEDEQGTLHESFPVKRVQKRKKATKNGRVRPCLRGLGCDDLYGCAVGVSKRLPGVGYSGDLLAQIFRCCQHPFQGVCFTDPSDDRLTSLRSCRTASMGNSVAWAI